MLKQFLLNCIYIQGVWISWLPQLVLLYLILGERHGAVFYHHAAPTVIAKCVSSICGNESTVETNEERTRRRRRRKGAGGRGKVRPTGEEEKRSSQLEKENFLPCRRHPSPSDRRRRRRGYSSVTRTALRGNPPPSSSRFHQQKKIHAQTPIVSYFC